MCTPIVNTDYSSSQRCKLLKWYRLSKSAQVIHVRMSNLAEMRRFLRASCWLRFVACMVSQKQLRRSHAGANYFRIDSARECPSRILNLATLG